MAYDFTKSDGTPISVADGAIDTSQFSIGLVGKNVSGYGLTIAQTQTHLLEHFANNAQPSNPTRGQIWYDTSVNFLKVYDGTAWRTIISQDNSSTYVFDNDIRVEGDITLTGDLLPDVDCGPPGSDIGSSSLRFCNVYAVTFDGTATAARYSDLAERYRADKAYKQGTLVVIGGTQEITETKEFGDDVFSVISSAPGFMLNSEAGSDLTHPYVALTGRVPVRVVGKVRKGDRIIASDTPGVGVAETDSTSGRTVVGRSLEDSDVLDEKLVICVVRASI